MLNAKWEDIIMVFECNNGETFFQLLFLFVVCEVGAYAQLLAKCTVLKGAVCSCVINDERSISPA